MKPIRILGIAPYAGMAQLMQQAAAKRDDTHLTAYVGDLQAGAAIASQCTEEDYDVILSRGGTAEMIRQQSALPVVEVTLSAYDILRSIKLAEHSSGKYAIIGFPAITRNAHFLCEMLGYKLDIFTINTEAEARTLMQQLRNDGYAMVLCDMIAHSIAQSFGMPAMLINSGAESMDVALEQAIQTSHTYRSLRENTTFYQNILENQPAHLLVLSPDGTCCYASRSEPLPQPVLDKLQGAVPSILEDGSKRFSCEVLGKYYTITGTKISTNGQVYLLYTITSTKAVLSLQKYGIHTIDKEEAFDRFFNSFYGITRSSATTEIDIDRYAQSREAAMVFGELGTGKDQMVRLLYGKSHLNTSPLVIIDCAQLRTRGWNFLLENDYSPLTDSDITIHFKNTSALTDEQFLELFMSIKDLHVHQRNRLIFAGSPDANGSMPQRIRKITDWFSCLIVSMPPLRTHKKDIPNLASLYISMLNMQTAKEIIGFEAGALVTIEEYDWPNNYDQFKRVLHELVLTTDTAYIKTEDVKKAIKREIRMFGEASGSQAPINTQLTLEEMNLHYLKLVLAEEQGNQSAVAKRLGISRTTLWRMLQKCVDSDPAASLENPETHDETK